MSSNTITAQMPDERIHYEWSDPTAWVCLCGNRPTADGFFPIDEDHTEVVPDDERWTTNQYVCDRCGRVIDQATRRVVRKLDVNTIIRVLQ